jgi:hypothetical protein
MRRGIVLVGLTAVLGVGMATPALAETGVSVTECDQLTPNCSFYVVKADKVSGPSQVVGSFCNGYPAIPTVTEHCVYVELDLPVAAP